MASSLCVSLWRCVALVLALASLAPNGSLAKLDSADHDHHHHQVLKAFESHVPATRARIGPPRRSLAARAQALLETKRRLEAHNSLHVDGARSYFLAWNELSDLSDDEYRSFLRSRPDASHPQTRHRALLQHMRRKRSRSRSIM
ncbi:hypothetical protein PINS_up004536 [Pythium insidiosum]|nr:hypothetical protein PINS_up004536 [Pythium insidiosum]